MNYYKDNAIEYINKTKDVNMKDSYEFFLKYAKSKGKILDIGFGSGRDMLYFKSLGFDVYGIDMEKTFVDEALKLNLNVSCKNILDMNDEKMYDYIWASASLLHIEKDLLNKTFKICNQILSQNGIMYCSFKYGDFEGIKDDRYYVYLTENSISNYLKDTNLKILDIKITKDNLNRDNKWLNVILRKDN